MLRPITDVTAQDRLREVRSEMRREVADASVLSFIYLVVLVGSILVVAQAAGPGFSLADVIFECVSAQSTIGLSSGLTDPGMPVLVELVFIVQMWVGRLEFFPVIILIGAIVFVPFNPSGLTDAFTALPIQIFNWTTRPQEEFKLLAAAAIVVLLALLLTMNAFAIWLRNKYQRRW